MIQDTIKIDTTKLTNLYEIEGIFVTADTKKDAIKRYLDFFLLPSTYTIGSIKLVSPRVIIEQK